MTSLFSLTGLQEQMISAATQCSLPALQDFVEGVESLHRTSNTMQEHENATSAQQVGKTVRSLTDPNQTSYSTPIQKILGESSQQSQPAGSKAVFPLPNTLKQGEWIEIPGQQQYARSQVSNTLSLKGRLTVTFYSRPMRSTSRLPSRERVKIGQALRHQYWSLLKLCPQYRKRTLRLGLLKRRIFDA